jgi:hypothetical protein
MMLRSSLIPLVALLGSSLPLAAVDTTLAGWTFSQFISEGYPSVDGGTGDPTGFVAATYRGSFDPVSEEVDGTVTIQTGASGYVDTTFGAWSFANFDFSNAFDVRADTFGTLNTFNSTTLDGKSMHLTDSGGMMLTFNTVATPWTITVGGTQGYANASTSDFTFAARGNGGPAVVEWLFNGEVFSTIEIAAGSFSTYSAELPAAFYGNGVIQGRLVSGSVSFDNVQVNGQLGTPPTFTTLPVGLVRLVGQSASFSVEVSGAVTPTYQWFKGSTLIQGASSSSFTIDSVTLENAGNYRVSVRSANGTSADSEFVALEVRQAPAISQPPAAQSANPGQTITFAVVATGSPAPSYRWQRNGSDLSDTGNVSGSATATLTVASVSSADAGAYRVVVANVVSTVESATAALTVSELSVAPTVSTAPANATAVVGASVEFSVAASGAPAPAYKWYLGEELLSDGEGISGATTGKLTLSGLSAARAGTYRVVISNSAGTVEREAVLTVQTPPAVVSGPGPATRSVLAGSNVSFSVQTSGNPTPTLQWLRDGDAIDGQTDATLNLNAVDEGDEGAYSVRVTNAAGAVTSGTSSLAVGRNALITGQPSGSTIAAGASFTLRVTATGRPAPTYQWLRNGEPIDDAEGASYVITGASAASAGDYTVRVANEFATEESQVAAVRVAQTVSIAKPRVAQLFPPGSTLSLGLPDVEVSPSLRYVWLRNGKVIPGANAASLLIESAAFGDSGSYTLRIYGAGNRLLGSRLVATIRITVAGVYDSLLLDPVDAAPLGALSLNVAALGTFTGSIRHEDGKSYPLRGAFTFPTAPDQGRATVTVTRGALAPIVLEFALDASTGELSASRRIGAGAAVSGTGLGLARIVTKTAPWAGSYTLALNAPGEQPDMSLAVTINARASLQLRGVLPDGVRVTGTFPSDTGAGYVVALRPYAKIPGLFAGGLRLESSLGGYFADEDSSGVWSWTRAASGERPAVDQTFAPALAP